ncbi:MAG: hypothetical protein ACI9AR_000434 [Flavobacteriaceae bacterium]|jgi:hypothetical protein
MAKKVSAKKDKSKEVVKGIALGAGLVTLAAAGYFLLGPKGKENRKKVRGWTLKAKGEVLEKFEKLEEVSEDKYHEIVDGVIAKYKKAKHVAQDELGKFEKEIRSYWKSISKEIKAKTKPAAKKKAPASKAKKVATKKKPAAKKKK